MNNVHHIVDVYQDVMFHISGDKKRLNNYWQLKKQDELNLVKRALILQTKVAIAIYTQISNYSYVLTCLY